MKSEYNRRIRTRSALQKISFRDLTLFEAVARHESLAGAARELGLRYPYMTKTLQSLERDLGTKLLNRTSLGVGLTPEGADFLELCKRMIETLDQTRWMSSTPGDHREVPLYTIAGPTYLLAHLVAPFAPRALKNENIGLRLFDLGNSEMLSGSFRDQFEIAIYCDKMQWSQAWKSYPIGPVQWVLCARKQHPLGLKASEAEVLRFPFVLPTTSVSQGFRLGSDHCPIPEKQRSRRLEVRTSEIGMKSVENTDQLIFLPKIQAADLIRQNRLQIIDVAGWAPIRKTAYLTVHQDKVMQKDVNVLLQALENGLSQAIK